MSKIPNSLHEVADRLSLDLSGFEVAGKPIDWAELFGWMRHWAENDGPDLERAPRQERAATMAQLNDCLARAIVAQLRASGRR